MRHLIRRIGFVVALSAAGATPALLGAQLPASPAPPPQIETTGRAEVHVTPDRATVLIGVASRAVTAAAAAADNARRQRAILDTLRSIGLANDQLSTENYTVSPQLQYSQNGQPPRVTGYLVANTVRIEVRQIADVGKVIDAGLAKGANEVSGLDFYSSQADSARRSALASAVAMARADAEVIARAAGGGLGALIELSSEPPSVRPMLTQPMMMMQRADAVATPIQPGQQTINAVVTAHWAFVAVR